MDPRGQSVTARPRMESVAFQGLVGISCPRPQRLVLIAKLAFLLATLDPRPRSVARVRTAPLLRFSFQAISCMLSLLSVRSKTSILSSSGDQGRTIRARTIGSTTSDVFKGQPRQGNRYHSEGSGGRHRTRARILTRRAIVSGRGKYSFCSILSLIPNHFN
jgi:hypothetical protein